MKGEAAARSSQGIPAQGARPCPSVPRLSPDSKISKLSLSGTSLGQVEAVEESPSPATGLWQRGRTDSAAQSDVPGQRRGGQRVIAAERAGTSRGQSMIKPWGLAPQERSATSSRCQRAQKVLKYGLGGAPGGGIGVRATPQSWRGGVLSLFPQALRIRGRDPKLCPFGMLRSFSFCCGLLWSETRGKSGGFIQNYHDQRIWGVLASARGAQLSSWVL